MKQKYPTKAERAEYEAREKICPVCAKRFYGNWAKWVLSPYCSEECARRFSSTVKKDEKNKKIQASIKRYCNSKERKIKLEEKRKAIIQNNLCPICGKELTWKQIEVKNKTCGPACGAQLANKTKEENGTVFVENGQGWGKSGHWNGFFVNSTYELVYYIFMTEHGHSVERNKKRYKYVWNGKNKTYIPDFRVDGKLVEIKGYPSLLTETKLAAVNDEDIQILYYKDLEHMMCYVDSKYGTRHNSKNNNYETLYKAL